MCEFLITLIDYHLQWSKEWNR